MSRKSESAGAVIEKPTRQRKSPKQRAESLTVRACNAVDALGSMAGKLNEAQREAVHGALKKKVDELDVAFQDADNQESEPEVFALPD